jgi:hypothetical protein
MDPFRKGKHEASIMLDKPAIERERPAEPSTMPFAIPTWPMPIWPSMADAASWNGKVLQGLTLLGGEWLDFVTRRLKEDVNLPTKFAACRSPNEISSVYAAFWKKLVDDYWKEFAVLGKLGGDIAASAGSVQRRRAEAAAESRSLQVS